MALGPITRRFLGPRLARLVGEYYRAIFVDLALVAKELAGVIPRGAHLLDVGGGDGLPLNHLLSLRPTLVLRIGSRAHSRPVDQSLLRGSGESLDVYQSRGVCSVVTSASRHPINCGCDAPHPRIRTSRFSRFCAGPSRSVPGLRIIVKDVEPGYCVRGLVFGVTGTSQEIGM